MTVKSIKEMWTDYVRDVLAPAGIQEGSPQFVETRRTFYMGVSASLAMMANSPDHWNDDDLERALRGHLHEIRKFLDQIAEEESRELLSGMSVLGMIEVPDNPGAALVFPLVHGLKTVDIGSQTAADVAKLITEVDAMRRRQEKGEMRGFEVRIAVLPTQSYYDEEKRQFRARNLKVL